MVSSPSLPALVATVFQKSSSSSEVVDSESNSCLPLAKFDDIRQSLQAVLPSCDTQIRSLTSSEHPRVVEILIQSHQGPVPALKDIIRHDAVTHFESSHNAEIVLQDHAIYSLHKEPGLAVFDMDSTLIQQEVIDEIAASLGPSFSASVSAITARAMNGELDFTESLRERCLLLKGVKATIWEELRDRITLTPGARDLVACLRKLGWKTAVLSGGFIPTARWLAEQIGLDHAYANSLVVSENGRELTGELVGDIVHAERKRKLVLELAETEGIPLGKVVCVGDGANDLLMMGVAGLGVAFNAKEKVQREAPARLNSTSLMDVMYLLGYSKEEQEKLLS